MKPDFRSVLRELDLLNDLARFEPTVIGTPPLGIDLESSDIDIACTHDDLREFELEVTRRFNQLNGFQSEHFLDLPGRAVRAAFSSHGWEVELFCQTIPIQEQWGFRHFLIEKRLLKVQPALKSRVIQLKRSGLKTEPAFAAALGLDGDPFEAMLLLESYSDRKLRSLVMADFETSDYSSK